MNKEEFKEIILQIYEFQLDYQLRAIHELQGKLETEPIPVRRGGRRRQSLVDLSINILLKKRNLCISMISSYFFNSVSDVSPTGIPCPVLWPKKLARAFFLNRELRPHSLLSNLRRIPMQKPDLELLAQWLDPALMIMLDGKRRLKNEWRRRRKLATLEMLWLMLAVSLDTHRSSLYKILRLATGHLDIKWSISVAAFCKARARFSPGGFILVAWGTGRGCKQPARTNAVVGMGCACSPATRPLYPYPNLLPFTTVSVHTKASRDWGRLPSNFVASLI